MLPLHTRKAIRAAARHISLSAPGGIPAHTPDINGSGMEWCGEKQGTMSL